MVTTKKKLTTADELASMPDDDLRHELVEGELITMPPASGGHGRIAARIQRQINLFDPDAKLGEAISADTGYMLSRSPDTVRAPDLAFVANKKLKTVQSEYPFPRIAPDLPVEILSPSNTAQEVSRLIDDYLQAGSSLVWVVDPAARSVTVWKPDETAVVLHEDDEIDGGEVLPGFKCRVGEFFPDD
jgi:Uma2 family endonuclease